jgi:Cu(I)/Ag(I) efflux system membrane protein CusA/SilA
VLFWHFRCWRRVGIVMASLPFAVSGAAWITYLLGYQWSFASAVGFLALAGVAAEFCVVMLLYLDQEMSFERARVALPSAERARDAVIRGAVLRLRPKTMTVAVILGGLVPIMLSSGVGMDVMHPVAAPIIGGMITAPLFSLLVVPAIYMAFIAKPGSHQPSDERVLSSATPAREPLKSRQTPASPELRA